MSFLIPPSFIWNCYSIKQQWKHLCQKNKSQNSDIDITLAAISSGVLFIPSHVRFTMIQLATGEERSVHQPVGSRKSLTTDDIYLTPSHVLGFFFISVFSSFFFVLAICKETLLDTFVFFKTLCKCCTLHTNGGGDKKNKQTVRRHVWLSCNCLKGADNAWSQMCWAVFYPELFTRMSYQRGNMAILFTTCRNENRWVLFICSKETRLMLLFFFSFCFFWFCFVLVFFGNCGTWNVFGKNVFYWFISLFLLMML